MADGFAQPVIARELLRSLPPRERVEALARSLEHAGTDEITPLGLELLELALRPGHGTRHAGRATLWMRLLDRGRVRVSDLALTEIVVVWSMLPTALRRLALVVAEDRLAGAIASAAARTGRGARISVARLLTDVADPSLAGPLQGLLGDKDDSVSRAAEAAIVRLALAAMPDTDPGLLGDDLAKPAERRILRRPDHPRDRGAEVEHARRVVADAAWSFGEHRRRGALLAAALLMDPPSSTPEGTRLTRLLTDTDHAGHAALRSLVRHGRAPLMRTRAWQWLTIEPMASVAAERLRRADSAAEHAAVLGQSHLALNPTRAHRAGRISVRPGKQASADSLPSNCPLPNAEVMGPLDADARRGLIRLTKVFAADEATRRLLLAPILADPDAGVRLAGATASGPVDLSNYCFDPSPAVARLAALRWSAAGEGSGVSPPDSPAQRRRAALAGKLTRSPHHAVRRIAHDEAARIDPWDASSVAGRLAARRLHAADTAEFERRIHARLIGGDPHDRLGAAMLVRALGLTERFERELIAAATGVGSDQPSRKLAATAVAALGWADSDRARSVIDAALLHEDSRIRANAVEAAARRAPARGNLRRADETVYGAIVELKDDPHHRVRANALRSLIQLGDNARSDAEPAGRVADMLCDDRDTHRLAGVWLVERTWFNGAQQFEPWRHVAHRVAELAETDQSSAVKARARRCARKLLVEIRSGDDQRTAAGVA